METFFRIALFILFYTYIGYGLLLFMYNRLFKKKGQADEGFLPPVTFIVPAYNEAAVIRQKVLNSLELDYPPDRIFFLFITDGSVDNTVDIIRQYPHIRLLHHPDRQGKSAALNRAMQTVQTPFVVFSDANILLHPQSIKWLIRNYTDERVGGVSGEKKIQKSGSVAGAGERMYWQYESWLKKNNAAFYTLVGAAGELFSIRTALYQPVNDEVILDDFIISGRVCYQGFRFLYEEQAYGIEASSISLAEERKRKVRISAGSYQALGLMKDLLNPFKNFRVTFQYISYRVLRWTVCPLLLPVVFIINAMLVFEGGFIDRMIFWGQCLFYGLAFCGWLLPPGKVTVKVLLVPYYFTFMVSSQFEGFYRFAAGKQKGVWKKAARKPFADLPDWE